MPVSTRSKRVFGFTAAWALLLMLTCGNGCNHQATVATETSADSSTVAPSGTASSEGAAGKLLESPAEKEPQTPDGVVRLFLDYVHRQETGAAEQLLSKVSKVNFKSAGLLMEAPGSPEARYDIALPRYATNEQKLAMVECTINDTVEGEAASSQLTWMVRKDAGYWKIVGMLMVDEKSQAPQFLSFENADDVAFIKQNIFGEETATAEVVVSQANVNAGTTAQGTDQQR